MFLKVYHSVYTNAYVDHTQKSNNGTRFLLYDTIIFTNSKGFSVYSVQME